MPERPDREPAAVYDRFIVFPANNLVAKRRADSKHEEICREIQGPYADTLPEWVFGEICKLVNLVVEVGHG